MKLEEKSKVNMIKILFLLLLIGIYVFWFSVIATGSDILKGSFNIDIFSSSFSFDKITSFFMFLSFVTIAVPTYLLGFLDDER